MEHLKIVLVGDSGVGKTSIANRISGNDINEEYKPTIGAAFSVLEREIDGNKYVFDLWDTAGQEVYRSLINMYARGSKGAIIVCDITNEESFHGIDHWVKFLKDNADSIQIIIAANKCDLSDQAVVTNVQLQSKAEEYGTLYYLTSAVTGEYIDQLFDRLGEEIVHATSKIEKNFPKEVLLAEKSETTQNNKKCCK